jgi:hypothetical protein
MLLRKFYIFTNQKRQVSTVFIQIWKFHGWCVPSPGASDLMLTSPIERMSSGNLPYDSLAKRRANDSAAASVCNPDPEGFYG